MSDAGVVRELGEWYVYEGGYWGHCYFWDFAEGYVEGYAEGCVEGCNEG